MKLRVAAIAAFPLVLSCHAAAAQVAESSAADRANADSRIEEILVLGKSLSSDAAHVDVISEPVLDAAESLTRLPGADANVNGRISGIAQYRGMFGDRVAVTVDGIGMISGGPNAMDAPLSYLSPMITEALVLERGIPGVASAPESIGGHIDARLARGEFGAGPDYAFAGMAGLRFSPNGDTRSGAARLTVANEQHRVSLLAEVDRADSVDTPAGRIVPSRVERKRADLSYAFSRDDTEVLVFVGGLDTDDTGTPALAMDIRTIDTAIAGAQFSTRIAPAIRLDARAGFNDVEHRMDNFTLRPAASPAAFRQNDTTGRGGTVELAATLERGAASYRIGLDGRWARHESLISNPQNPAFAIENFTDLERDLHGVFAVANWEAGANAWEFGLRHNTVRMDTGLVGAAGMMGMMAARAGELADAFNAADRSRTFASLDAVLKYRRQLGSHVGLVADIGTKSRAPAYQEMYLWLPLAATGGLADGRSYIGNLELEPERSREIVLGLHWSGDRLEVSPQVYFRKIDRFIQGVPATNMAANMLATMMSGIGALQFDNVDAEIAGLDVGWQFAISDSLYLDGSAAYVRGRRIDADDKLYRLPPVNASIALNLLRGRHSLRLEAIGFASQDDVSAYNAEQRSAGYGLANALWAWQPSKSLQIQVQASNIFDKSYQPHLVGINRVDAGEIPAGERLYGAERSLTLGALLRF